MMTNQTSPAAARRRWTWRQFLVLLVVIGTGYLACLVATYDSGRSKAEALFDAFKPDMSRDQVIGMVNNAKVSTQGQFTDICFDMDHKYTFWIRFNGEGKMVFKSADPQRSQLHRQINHFLKRNGLMKDERLLMWTGGYFM